MLKPFLILLLISLLGLPSYAQNILVTSHYPSSAFITERLLPFSIDQNSGLKIQTVVLFGADDNCVSLVDPFYNHIFHVYCYNPATFNLSVEVLDGFNRTFTLAVGAVQVRELTSSEAESTVNFNPASKRSE